MSDAPMRHPNRIKLIRTEKLAVLGRLAGNVSHELRNPLGVINNSIYFLEMISSKTDPKLKKHIDIVRRELNRTNTIIGELLHFTKAGTIVKSPVDINLLIAEVAAEQSKIRGLDIHFTPGENIPEIAIDSEPIRRVFINIIDNAVQSLGENGRIDICTKSEAGNIVITTEDNGCGMDRETIDSIFEPLFTTKPKGIGLGMAIVKDIIDKHDGAITINSLENRGTMVVITLPG